MSEDCLRLLWCDYVVWCRKYYAYMDDKTQEPATTEDPVFKAWWAAMEKRGISYGERERDTNVIIFKVDGKVFRTDEPL